MLNGVKRCKNTMCGKLIYSYQKAWNNEFCDLDCADEIKRDEHRIRKNENNHKWQEVKTIYPHNWLPVRLIIE